MTRIEREKRTVGAMISLYCRAHHSSGGILCDDCSRLKEYAFARLERCPFGEGKSTCAKCPVHCYKPEMRERIRKVMRYSGPRMLFRHPALALMHKLDSRRPAVSLEEARQRAQASSEARQRSGSEEAE